MFLISSDLPREVEIHCTKCNEKIPITVTEEHLEGASTGLVTLLHVHGNPPHAVMVYLDKQLSVRGIEYPAALQIREAEPQVEVEIESDLSVLVELLHEDKGTAISNFTKILSQLLLGNWVYFVKEGEINAEDLMDGLKDLITMRETLVFSISMSEMDTVRGRRPVIYDLGHFVFISEGIDVDSKHLEKLVKNSLRRKNAFSKLKDELQSITASYIQLREILASGNRPSVEELADQIQVHKGLVPLLLKMGESEGLDISRYK